MKPGFLTVLSTSIFAAVSMGADETQDFYEVRLTSGFEAVRATRVSEGIDEFRIAAFGLMEKPPLLTEALVRLALAQDAIGSKEAADETVKRFLEIERRFGAYAAARLEPAARAAFGNLLGRHAPGEAMVSPPSRESPPPAPAESPTSTESPTSSKPATSNEPPTSTEPSIVAAQVPEPQPEPAESPSPPSQILAGPYAPPRYRTRVDPTYPSEARRDRASGIVLLQVLVSETGEPLKVEVLRTDRPDLAQAAVSAVKRWTFEPARRDGLPVQASVTVPISFQAPKR